MKRWVVVASFCAGCVGGRSIRTNTIHDSVGAPPPLRGQRALETSGGLPVSVAMVEVARGFAVDELGVSASLNLSDTECVLVDVALSPGVLDADLVAFDDEGNLIASDYTHDRFALLELCGSAISRAQIRASVARGAGEIGVRVGNVAPNVERESAAIHRMAESARASTPTTAVAGGASLSASLVRAAEQYRARGFSSVREGAAMLIQPEAPLVVPLTVNMYECLAVTAVADSPTAAVRVRFGASASTAALDTSAGSVEDLGHARLLRVEVCENSRTELALSVESDESTRLRWFVARGSLAEVGGHAALRYGVGALQNRSPPARPVTPSR